ncbi:hypothetical protein SOVF_063280, partial [Spinacia oleracea]
MASEQPASTSGRCPGKEPVTDDIDMATGEYSDGDSIFEDSAGKDVDEHRGGDGDEAGVSGRNDTDVGNDGIGSDDDDPADVIVAEVLADEAKEQPYFTDDSTDVHRREELPPLDSLPRTKTLDRDIFGFDENWRPVCTQPPPPKGKYDTISTYSTRASSRRSAVTVAKNRVGTGSKTKSSSASISKTAQPSNMQSNPTGRGGKSRKRSSLTSGRSDPNLKSKAAGGDDVSAAPSIEILDIEGGGGENEPPLQHCATSAAVTGGNSSMPPVSRSENRSGDSRLNYHLPLRTGGWIEDTPFKIPPAMKSWFGSPGGEPTDQFYPNIDLLCGESVVQSSIDLYYVYRWNQLQLAQNSIDIAELKKRAEAAEAALKDSAKKLETASSDLEAVNKRLEDVEPKLKAETERADDLTQQLIDLNRGLPGVKKTAAKRAVDKLLQSD